MFANYNQALPNNAAGSIALQLGGPIPEFGDITYSFNGGKSRYNALQVKYRVPHAPWLHAPELVHLVEVEGQRRGLAREPQRQLGPQNFYDLDAD